MTSLILQLDISDYIDSLSQQNDQFIVDWFSYHLNRLWGINVDLKHIRINPSYLALITDALRERQYELFWRFKMPVLTGINGYDCKIVYMSTLKQIHIYFS